MHFHQRALFIAAFAGALGACLAPGLAADIGDAGQPGAFMRAGTGARALGMGNSYAALAGEAGATSWNAAGLARLDRPEFTSMYSVLTLKRRFEHLAVASPLSLGKGAERGALEGADAFPCREAWGGLGVWSLSWTHFSLGDDFEGRTADTRDYYLFGDDQEAFTLGHGRALASWLGVGAAVKYIQHTLERGRATGWGLDCGLIALPFRHLAIGVSMIDAATQITWDTGTVEKYPTLTRISLASPWLDGAVIATGQVQGIAGSTPKYSVGFEGWLYKTLAGRIGYYDGAITAGAGVSVAIVGYAAQVDYGFATEPSGLGDTHRVSLSFVF